jgi:hypothetical protein
LTPVSRETTGDRIELKNLAKRAVQQLEAVGADKRRVAALAGHLDDLVDDAEFWRFQARGLAVLATPDNVRTFRVPNALEPMVEVADRFHLKPLLRAVTFPNTCYVLALAEGGVRLVEVSADLPATALKVDGMPKNAGDAVRRSGVNDRAPSGRIQGAEGQKVLLSQYARKVDRALRGLLAGSDVPLVLAAAHPLEPIYRSVNTYSHLASMTIAGSPETLSDADLAARARSVLDGLYGDEIAAFTKLFETRQNQGRATTDIAQAARAATYGAARTDHRNRRSGSARMPRRDLLDNPRIAVPITEGEERPVAHTLGVGAFDPRLRRERGAMPHVARLNTTPDQILVGR